MFDSIVKSLGLDAVYYGNSLGLWLLSGFSALLLLVFFSWVRGVLASRLRLASSRPRMSSLSRVSQLIADTSVLTLAILSVHIASNLLSLTAKFDHALWSMSMIALTLQAASWLSNLSSWTLTAYTNLTNGHAEGPSSGASALGLLSFLSKFLIWMFALILILDNLGINITALVTGLGIGGVAVALAVQNILGDLLASISIVLDKPFEIGDLIVVGEFSGHVERIGMKTTRLRSITGEQLVFANSELLKSRIRNYKRMNERRVVFSLSIEYDHDMSKLKRIPDLLKEIVSHQDYITFDRAHLKSLDPNSLIFEIVYLVPDSDYTVFMNVQQRINFEILEKFREEGISLARPTQTLEIRDGNTKRALQEITLSEAEDSASRNLKT